MRVLVTGSRDWPDEGVVHNRLDALYGTAAGRGDAMLVIVHGGCPTGADAQAEEWVLDEQHRGGPIAVVSEIHPAKWQHHQPQCSESCRAQSYCKRAGFVRNLEMVESGADWVLAFIKDHSNGASHTLDLARRAGIAEHVDYIRSLGGTRP